MNIKHYLQLLLMASMTMAEMPFRGTIQSTTGTPISGAKVVAISNRVATVSNSEGQFGKGGTSIVTGDVGTFSIAKPLLQKKAFYFNATSGQDYSYRLIDARGRAIVELSGKAEASGMQTLSLSNQMLADGFYINILQVGDKKEVFKSVIAGNRTARPQMKNENNVHSARAAVTSAPDVSLVDTLYFSAKGFKNKKVPVSDTGSVGVISLEAVGSDPEIFCHDITLAYTPDNFPSNRKDTVALSMALFNGGGANALSVKCSIATADPEITIVVPTVGFDNIAAGSDKSGLSSFKMLIPREYKAGKNIPFRLFISDSWGGSWDGADLYMPYPFMVTKQKFDDDTIGGSWGNDNGLCEKGETFEYTPMVKNMSGVSFDSVDLYFAKSSSIDTLSKFFPGGGFKREIGTLKNGEEKLPSLDFLLQTNISSVSEFKEDLIIKADEYYLLPIDLNDNTLENPTATDAKLQCAEFILAYDETNFPLHRGDSMVFSIGIQNSGTENAYSVSCSLSTLTEGIAVQQKYLDFDNIIAGDTTYVQFQKMDDTLNIKDSIYALERLFLVHVPRTFPAGQQIDFVLNMKDSWGKSWLDTVKYTPHPFAISQDMIDDDSIPASKGDGDGIIEVGETIEYIPQLQNYAGYTIENLTGQMMANESFEYINDTWKYGTIDNGAKKLPEFDYVFKVLDSKENLNSSDMLMVSKEDGDSTFYIVPLGLKGSVIGVPVISVMKDTIADKGEVLTLTASAIDYDGQVEKYIWSKNGTDFNDSTNIGEYSWTSLEGGFHRVYVKAMDNDGNVSQVASIGISVRGTTFSKILDMPQSDVGVCVRQKSNGEIWVLSTIGAWGNGLSDILLVAMDENGDTLWTKTYGAEDDDYAGTFHFTDDGGALAVWSSHGFTPEENRLVFCRFDANGDSLWTKSYATGGSVNVYDLQPVGDGYYATARMTDTIDNGTGDEIFWLLRLNANADTLWSAQNNYGSDYYSNAKIAVTSDGGCYMSINKLEIETGLSTPFVYRYNSSGEELWKKSYTTYDREYYSNITLLDDGGFLLSGIKTEEDSRYGLLTFCASNGDVQYHKSFGIAGQEYSFNAVVKIDGGLLLTGHTAPLFSESKTDLLLTKIDFEGNEEWSITYDNSGLYDKGHSVSQTSDGGILITGFADASTEYGDDGDIWVLSTNADGTLSE